MRRAIICAALAVALVMPAQAQEMAPEQRYEQRAALDALMIRNLLFEIADLRAALAKRKADDEKAAKKD